MMIYDMQELDIHDNLTFIIRYCDFYMDYCHEENLSINGDQAGEIIDCIYVIEDMLEKNSLDNDEIINLYESLDEICENIISLNDISLFNNIHIVFTNIIKKTQDKLKQRCESLN